MAEEQEKAPEAAEEEKQPSKLKFKFKLPMKYLIIAGVVLAQIAGSYFLQKSLFFNSDAEASISSEVQEKDEHDDDHGHGEEGPADAPIIIMLDEIVVNPAGTEGRRYLATRIGIQTQTDSAEFEIQARSVLIRDAVISLLSSKSMAQLSSLTYRDSLRQEIRVAVDEQLLNTDVESIVFADYVLQ